MKPTFCYKQLKTGSVRFPRTDFVPRCTPQKVVPTPTNVFVANLGELPVRLFFTFNYPMNGSDYFNFIVTNLTNRTVEILRYQPAPIYNIGGLIVDNQYSISVQAVIDNIPRGLSVPTEPFSPGYGIFQFTKRFQYRAKTDSILIPDLTPGGDPIGYIAQRTASAICIDRQNNLVVALADSASAQGYILKYSNTGAIVFPNAVALPPTFTPYAIATDSNSDIYIAGYNTNVYEFFTTTNPVIVKLSGSDGSLIQEASNNDINGGIFTGIALSSTTIYLCGYVVSDIGTVQSIVLSKNFNLQDLALDIRPQDSDPDAGNILVARSICIDSLGRPVVTGYTQSPSLMTSSLYFVSIYEAFTLQRLLYFTNGVPGNLALAESVASCPDGGIAICGLTKTTLDGIGFIGIGGTNAFISKYNFSTYTNEELLAFSGDLPLDWTRLLGSTTVGGMNTQGLSTAVDSQGGIYVVGETTGGIAPFNQTGGIGDLFVVKYDASGTQKYLNQLGSTNFLPFLSSTFANSVAVNAYDDFFMAGVSDGIRFNDLTNPAGAEVPGIFVSKYSATG